MMFAIKLNGRYWGAFKSAAEAVRWAEKCISDILHESPWTVIFIEAVND